MESNRKDNYIRRDQQSKSNINLSSPNPSRRSFVLSHNEELRVQRFSDAGGPIKVILINGNANIFGYELIIDKIYNLIDFSFAIFVPGKGCEVVLDGHFQATQTRDCDAMLKLIDIHNDINKLRKISKKNNTNGPIVCVCGSMDVGKSTCCRVLLNYAIRSNHSPIFIELDVGQNQYIPGTISANLIYKQTKLDNDFFILPETHFLSYFFGHLSPRPRFEEYRRTVEMLADKVHNTIGIDSSGCFINTCGWVDGIGYSLLLHAIATFEVDTILVIDNEGLFNQLNKDTSGSLSHVSSIRKLPLSTGIVRRDQHRRRLARTQKFHTYFFGLKRELLPPQVSIRTNDIKLCTIIANADPTITDISQRLVAFSIVPDQSLTHNILAISHGKTIEKAAISNIAGFIYVLSYDENSQTLTCLLPCPGDMPSNVLIVGSIVLDLFQTSNNNTNSNYNNDHSYSNNNRSRVSRTRT